jgi:hypothetical protein
MSSRLRAGDRAYDFVERRRAVRVSDTISAIAEHI